MSGLRNFDQLNKLGEGAYSTVFKVRRKSDGEIYALKKVKIMSLKDKEKENALNEVRILASISHQNIIEYKECFLDDTTSNLCIVMEYADGGDLLQKITQYQKTRRHFEEREIWQMLVGLLQGLKTLHDRKILHRDLKCANVFMFNNGDVKLGDLNVSKVAERGLVYTQTGTPYYASPEVWKDKPYDLKSDIWSLGCVIYEVAALNPPFRAQDMNGLYRKVVQGSYPPIPSFYSDDLTQVIKLMLQVNPSQRPTCDRLLSLPFVHRNTDVNQVLHDDSISLLKTIKVPRNMNLLQNQLPAPNYERKNSYPGTSRNSQDRERQMIPRQRPIPHSSQASEVGSVPPHPYLRNTPPDVPRDPAMMPPVKPRNYRVSPRAMDYANQNQMHSRQPSNGSLAKQRQEYMEDKIGRLREYNRQPQQTPSEQARISPSYASRRTPSDYSRGMPRYDSRRNYPPPGPPPARPRPQPRMARPRRLPAMPSYDGPRITTHMKQAVAATKLAQIRQQYDQIQPSVYSNAYSSKAPISLATPSWWG